MSDFEGIMEIGSILGKKVTAIPWKSNEFFDKKLHPKPPSLRHLVLGSVGEGKTALVMALCDEYHSTWDMQFAFLGMPPRFQENCKKHNITWFYPVDYPEDTKIGTGLILDEAAFLGYSGSRSRTGECEEFKEALMVSRQNDLTCIAGTQMQTGIIPSYRRLADIIWTKRMTLSTLKMEDDTPQFVKDYAIEIGKLDFNEAILFSNSRAIDLQKRGGIAKITDIPLVPWWDHELLSKMYQGVKRHRTVDYNKLAQQAFDAKMRCKTAMERDGLVAWLKESNPTLKLKTEDIVSVRQKLALMYLQNERQVTTEIGGKIVPIGDNSFESWTLKLLEAKAYKSTQILALKGIFEHQRQKEIAKDLGVTQPWISTIIEALSEKELPLFYEAYCREKWGDNRKLPVYHDEVDAFRDGIAISIKYSLKSIKTAPKQYKAEDDCRPELRWIKENQKQRFILHFHNSLWQHTPQEKVMDLSNLQPASFKDE